MGAPATRPLKAATRATAFQVGGFQILKKLNLYHSFLKAEYEPEKK